MHTLVIYDSLYGNTERIAQAIADAMRAFGTADAVRVDPARIFAGAGVDLLIIGCPTQGWNATQAMRAFIGAADAADLRGLQIACFDTRFHKPRWLTGSAARVLDGMVRRMGVTPLAPPESFFVAGTDGPLEHGELGRAADWARTLATARQTLPAAS